MYICIDMEQKTFAQLGRVEAIRQLFEGTGYEPFGEPLWFEAGAGVIVTSATKTLLEGIDFNLEYFPLKHLGYKAVIAVCGELYAVMSQPRTLSVTLGVSAKLDFSHVRELWNGVVTAAKELSVKSLSLELQPSKNGLSVSVAVTGVDVPGAGRSKAQSKDLICISGRLGAAFLGQMVLERKPDELEKHKMLLAAYLKPELEASLPERFVETNVSPSFGYFVTRGLSDALLRLSRDSGLGVKVYADKIPFEGGSFDLGKALDLDPISAAMNGGDDFVLLYVIPISRFEAFRREFKTFEVIGHLARPEVGAVLVSPDGLEHPVSAPGWDM